MQTTLSHSSCTIKSIAGNLSINDAKQIRIDLCADCTMRWLVQLSVALFAGDAVCTPNTAEINSFRNGFSCASKESVSLGMLSGLRFKRLASKPVWVIPQMSLAPKVRRSQLFQFGVCEHKSKHQSVTYQHRLSAARLPRKLNVFVMFLSEHLTCPTLTLTRIFDIAIVRFLIDNKLQLKVLISSYEWRGASILRLALRWELYRRQ